MNEYKKIKDMLNNESKLGIHDQFVKLNELNLKERILSE